MADGGDDIDKNIDSSSTAGKAEGSSSIPITLPKRETTDSFERETKFFLPMPGSPPKIITLNELNNLFKNIESMELVHEIALNPDFKLIPYEPPPNSLEKRVKEIMHKAFWNILKEQLNSNPPRYDHAIQLLSEIKDCFPQILSAKNEKILDHINEVLDLTLIRKQAEENVLNFPSYADFIIKILSKCCAPVRDQEIEAIKKLDDIVDIFKAVLDTMSNMKLDMANFLLEFARNDLVANSVEYEKKKFNEYLEYYKFGFPKTENWLKRNQIVKTDGQKSTVQETIFNAYMDLLNIIDENEFPEILKIDKERILRLNIQAIKICVIASVISISSAVPIVAQHADKRQSLADELIILLQNCENKANIQDLAENIWIHICTSINKLSKDKNNSEIENNIAEVLQNQITSAVKIESAVYTLLWKRLETFLRLSIKSKDATPPPPPGFLEIKVELESFAKAYKRIITYNYSVFGDYYTKVLDDTNTRLMSTNSA